MMMIQAESVLPTFQDEVSAKEDRRNSVKANKESLLNPKESKK